MFSSAFGQLQQLHEWTNFVAFNEFCIRGCKDGPRAPALCQHIYDVMGCEWNMPGNYGAGVFEKCKGDTGEVRRPAAKPVRLRLLVTDRFIFHLPCLRPTVALMSNLLHRP